MQKNSFFERNKNRFIKKPALYATAIILIAICLAPLASSCIPQPGIQLIKTGPIFGYAGDEITYTYSVSNTGSVPLSNVNVADDSCGPGNYVSGDENQNDNLDISEVWTFSCTYIPSFTFPDPLTNTATAYGTWDDQTTQDTDQYTLFPFILRKNVLLYWEGENIDYTDPDTQFTMRISQGEETLDTFSISESTPKNLWLSQGTYQFTETDIPDGYLPAYDTITITTGETYPDFSQLNIITFDLSVQKTGLATCYPNDQITYHYTIRNKGPASVIPSLLDDLCGTPVYTGGDIDSNGLIDPSETWTYEAIYTVNVEPGSIIMNTVTVTDAEGANRAPEQWWLGGDVNLSNNIANWSITVIPQPDEPEEPTEPEEPQEPEPPEEPLQPTTTHSHFYHSGDIAPVANASGPYNAMYHEEIIFNGSHSYDPDGIIIYYGWSFGDGETANGEKVTHTYADAGIYQVMLTIIDNLGVSDTDVTNASIVIPNRPPATPLIAGPGNGTKNTDYSYVFGSSDEDHDDITYFIDWGDGTTYQTEYLPSGTYIGFIHQWDIPGTYTITVTASDGTLTATSTKDVTIHEMLIADNIAIIALALLALIALLAITLYSKKKKNSQ